MAEQKVSKKAQEEANKRLAIAQSDTLKEHLPELRHESRKVYVVVTIMSPRKKKFQRKQKPVEQFFRNLCKSIVTRGTARVLPGARPFFGTRRVPAFGARGLLMIMGPNRVSEFYS